MRSTKRTVEHDYWISVGDLMSGLLLLFVLLIVTLLANTDGSKERVFTVLEEELKKAGLADAVKLGEDNFVMIKDNLLFELDKWDLTLEGKSLLDTAVVIISKSIKEDATSIYSIDIEGYASEKGRAEIHNMDLSIRRAQAVWEYIYSMPNFMNKKMLLNKLKVSGFGNFRAKSSRDQENDRKVMFHFQFINPLDMTTNASN